MIRRHMGEEPAFYYAEELGRSPMSAFYDAIDQAVGDWDRLARPLASVFSHTFGRPTDHVLYLKMFLVGYFQNVIYDTRLTAVCADSMAIRRFLGLTLVDEIPDHSSLSRVRASFGEHGGLVEILEQIVALCVREGLVGSSSVHVDTTLVRANASIKAMCSLDSDKSVHEHLKEARENGCKATITNSEFYSPSDPEARLRKKRSDKPLLCYMGVHVTDSKNQVVVSARVDSGDSAETSASLPAVAQAKQSLTSMGEQMDVVCADKGFDCVEFHHCVEEMGLRPATFGQREIQVPGRLSRSDFVFDAERNRYICPLGKELSFRGYKENRLAYVSKMSECKNCPLRDMCLGAKGTRKEISRMPGEEASERNRAFVACAEGRRHLKARAHTVEPPFGHMKRYGGLERLNCRGLAKAGVKFMVGAVAWNLLKLVKAGGPRHTPKPGPRWTPNLGNPGAGRSPGTPTRLRSAGTVAIEAVECLCWVFRNRIPGRRRFHLAGSIVST